MDKQTTERDLVMGAIEAARAHGLNLRLTARGPRIQNKPANTTIDLRVGNHKTRYRVEVKKGLRPATLGVVLMRLQEFQMAGDPILLISDYVTPPLADTLKELGVAFLDATGNAYINQPPVLVWIKGEKPEVRANAEGVEGRAFQAKGMRVVFALLCEPDRVDLPYRQIADLAGVAHGTVGWVMKDMENTGFVIQLQRQRRLRNRRRLLDMWVEAYARVLRKKLLLGRYRAPGRDWWKGINVQDYGLQLGGEPAAAELDGYLHPGVATFYGQKAPAKFIADHQLRTAKDGDVELRKRFWNFDHEWPWTTLVPPVLIYADLLAMGDARCLAAAQRIYEKHLAGFIEQA